MLSRLSMNFNMKQVSWLKMCHYTSFVPKNNFSMVNMVKIIRPELNKSRFLLNKNISQNKPCFKPQTLNPFFLPCKRFSSSNSPMSAEQILTVMFIKTTKTIPFIPTYYKLPFIKQSENAIYSKDSILPDNKTLLKNIIEKFDKVDRDFLYSNKRYLIPAFLLLTLLSKLTLLLIISCLLYVIHLLW
jgi:hypothetical protein